MLKFKLVAGICLLLAFALYAGPAAARVSGACANCHTMHNSQDGSAVFAGGPSPNLLSNDCVGCHSSADAVTIHVLGSTRIPIVYNQTLPTYPADGSNTSTLAGGNFYWIAHAGGDAYGHNVYGISAADVALASGAPGGSVGCTNCHGTLSSATAPETETGCRGCHVPHHHANDTATVVAETGGWYRFLGDNTAMAFGAGTPRGVIGIEDEDWEQNPSKTNHNVYQGTTDLYGRTKTNTEYSIGEFCSGCHGDFHFEMNTDQPTGTTGAWIRHPSDVAIPNSGEYAGAFGLPDRDYNPLVPVAKSTAIVAGDENFSSVTIASDVVTCLSCHRPHGSPYPDMLRWDYLDGCDAGAANADCGCFACHTTKD